jgi:translation initiation factor IF-2
VNSTPEELESKKKPKTALIKHKKAEEEPRPTEEVAATPEKKKVVVVKKKIVMKKPAPAAAPEPEKAAAIVEPSPAVQVHEKPKARMPERPPEPRPSVRESARIGAPLRRPAPLRPSGGEGRPSYGPRPPSGGRPSFGPRPSSGGRPSETSTSKGEDKKPTAKKFYSKTRKKFEYPKRKHMEVEEKSLQVKKKTVIMANPVPKEISITGNITVSDLAKKMNLKASELIHKLMSMGMMVTMNDQIDADTAQLVASEYSCKVNVVSLYDETVIEDEKASAEDLRHRPPIVTIMGHVDHGKTKLLDAIRSTNVAEGEYGGITQHIGAYTVDLPKGQIVFLDTPGHEAFTMMRARGAQVTDLVVLVVSAVDGVMPQTVEAYNHAKEARVPVIVAANKIDLPEANIDLLKKQLTELGLAPEDWGGTAIFNEVSALKKIGIQELLESILLQAEVLELKAPYDTRATGIVLESRVDMGRGIVATIICKKGTLRIGDSFVAGIYPGKVRSMFNDRGEKVTEATPSLPIEVVGFTSIPNAGDPFQVTDSERTAKIIGAKRQELRKLEESKNVKKITLDNLYEQIKEGQIQELKVIIKADVHGSVEALQTAVERLSTSEVRLQVIHAAAGAIIKDDVMLASASNAIIIGFHVRPSPEAQSIADREKVEIRKYNIIYDAIEDIRAAMEGMLKPELKEELIGSVEVRNTFKIPKIGTIAGCHVVTGKIKRNAEVRLIREGVEVFKGKITSLKRFKDDAREVEEGFECGIGLDNYHDIKAGDTIEVYEVHELAKKLEGTRDGGNKTQTN